jgi:soluble lytic murein transglycosylase-like protein
MGAIPIVGLLLVLVFSFPSNDSATRSDEDVVVEHSQVIVEKESTPDEARKDYKTILSFIKNKYKKIKLEDARLIADRLVQYGKEHGLDPKFAAALIARESAFNKEAISSTGAKGLGQIKDFNFKSLKIKNPHDINQNVSGTTSYMKQMLSRWKGKSDKVSLALASYYKGYTAVKNTEGEMDSPTKGYVKDILKNYHDLLDLREEQDH